MVIYFLDLINQYFLTAKEIYDLLVTFSHTSLFQTLVYLIFWLTFAATYRERPREGPYDVLATCNQGANSPPGLCQEQMR